MNETSPAAATSCGKSSQCLQGNWEARRAAYQFSHVSRLQQKGLDQSTPGILWCASGTALLPSSCVFGGKSSVRKRGCTTPSSEFGAARGVTSSSSLSLKYFRTEESPCMRMHKLGILQLLKTLQLPNWFAGKKEKKKKKDKAMIN